MAEAREFAITVAAAQIAATQVIVETDGDKTRNIMLGKLEELKGMEKDDAKAFIRARKMVDINAYSILCKMKKGEVVGDLTVPAPKKQSVKKQSGDAAVDFAERVSSGAATSSAPPAEVVEEQAAIEGEIYAALESDLGVVDPLHAQKESFKRLRNELKVKKITAWMLEDGPSTPFLDWVLSKWPDLHEQALDAAMAEHGLDNESA